MQGYGWGGSEELWAAMSAEALRDGHSVFISVKSWPTVPAKLAAVEQLGATISRRRVYPASSRRRRILNAVLRRNLWQRWAALREFAPDVICISQGDAYECCGDHVAGLYEFCTQASVPCVVLCQGSDERYVPPQRMRDRAIKLFSKASIVATVSKRQIALAERQLGNKLLNARVLRNPVNLASPERSEPWPTAVPARLAAVAFLEVRFKGQDILFATLGSPSWLKRDWTLDLFGSGPDREYLQELSRHYGIHDRVHFAGHVKDVRKIWSDHHLLVLPSRIEGTPLAMVEAMLCGRPSVVTDVGGTAEWVEEGVSGFIAESPLEKYLDAALERAWKARASWQEIGQAARRRALTLYDPAPGRTLLDIICERGDSCS